MAKYIDADLLRKEIEFAKSVYDNPKRVVVGVADAFRQDGRAAMCDDILKKIDSLQHEESVPKDLEEAAWKYAGEHSFHPCDYDVTPYDCFIDGAEWQADNTPLPEDTVLFNKGVEEGKRLMMEEAVEGYVTFNYDAQKEGLPCVTVIANEKPLEFYEGRGFKLGDKVRIIIVKED